MKAKNQLARILFSCFLFLIAHIGVSQSPLSESRKGQAYLYWGYNHGEYTRSDINFSGADYDFTLHNVRAKDRQTAYDPSIYFGATKFTIPQYNIRIGYFISDAWSISIGTDHMKYVVQTNQDVLISGYIRNSETVYDGEYANTPITITEDFLRFEHTDGLNYINASARYHRNLFQYRFLRIQAVQGAELGVLVPRTNTELLNNESYDEFHFSGYGLSGVAALNFEFFKYFFFQAELKGGFIHMPDIRTTANEADRASQHFFFYQPNIVFGAAIYL